MFLAWQEMKREKTRYGLIVLMLFLISYLIFMLAGLSYGLAERNTVAIESWQTQSVVLNENANVSLNQSLLTKTDLQHTKLSKKEALVGQLPVVVKHKKRQTLSAQLVGLKKGQFIYQDMPIVKGRKAKTQHELVADSYLEQKGYHLGDRVTLNGSQDKYKLVGFTDHAEINIAPIVFAKLPVWHALKMAAPNVAGSGIISQRKHFKLKQTTETKSYPVQAFINKLPGYRDQNMTFQLMIGFLFVISMIIVAVFLYIITMQKMRHFAVLRVQGIPTKTLVGATLTQSLLLVVLGVALGLLGMLLTAHLLPAAVPMQLTPQLIWAGSFGMLVMGLLGSLLPVRIISRIDPLQALS
ncbi:MAG: FtsX-like permease family protein [Lactobacillus sp.]